MQHEIGHVNVTYEAARASDTDQCRRLGNDIFHVCAGLVARVP